MRPFSPAPQADDGDAGTHGPGRVHEGGRHMTLNALRPGALVAAAFMASIFALFFDWRGRLVRRLRADQGDHRASDIAHTRR